MHWRSVGEWILGNHIQKKKSKRRFFFPLIDLLIFTSDKEIKVVLVLELSNLFAVALEVGLALLANFHQDMWDADGLGLQLDDLERVGLEGLEILGPKGDEHDNVVGRLGQAHGHGAVLPASE